MGPGSGSVRSCWLPSKLGAILRPFFLPGYTVSGPPRSNLTDPRDRDTLHFDFTAGEDVCGGGGVVSRGAASSPAVLVVRVAGFLCSVLAWLWCGCGSVGSGARGLVGVFVRALPVLWSRAGGSSAPDPRECPASRARRSGMDRRTP